MDDFFRVDNLSKSFGKLMALDRVSFMVEQGERVGLIGPNGAGKTTLFNVVTGFYRCSFGRVVFKNRDVTKATPDKLAEMGMIRTFQIPRPFAELTVHDNVAVGTLFNPNRIQSLDLSTSEFIERILKGVNLHNFKDQLASVLGHGNLKLLELGRAQGSAPELLLLDEPFAGLTSVEIESVSKILRMLGSEGLTLIIVEHKLRELMKLVNRVIVLQYGRKIADGRPEDISKNEEVLKAYLGKRWAMRNA